MQMGNGNAVPFHSLRGLEIQIWPPLDYRNNSLKDLNPQTRLPIGNTGYGVHSNSSLHFASISLNNAESLNISPLLLLFIVLVLPIPTP